MRIVLTIFALLLNPIIAPAHAGDVQEIAGLWRTVRHGALVRIEDCGNATPCGRLVMARQIDEQGVTHDLNNPDPRLRTRPLIGLPILWGFDSLDEDWAGGWVYNPEDGKRFRARMRLLSPDRLQVTGCFGPFCRSQVWTRVTTH